MDTGQGAADAYPAPPENPSPYLCDEDGGTVWYPPAPHDYEPLDRVGGGPRTRADILENYNGILPESGGFFSADPMLEPGEQMPRTLFAAPEQDITLYLGTIHPRDDYDNSHLSVSVLVNYQPVDAHYQNLSPDRATVDAERVATGIRWPIDDDIEVVDVTIPSEAFPRPGMYDLSVRVFAYVTGRDYAMMRRVRVYRGDYRRQPHPCVEIGSISERTPLENEIHRQVLRPDALLTTDGMTAEDVWADIPAEPGQTRTIEYALLPVDEDLVRPFALVPFLNGRPLDWRKYIVAPAADPARPPGVVAYRGTFEVTLPDEPGEYRVMLGTWRFPFAEGGEVLGAGIGAVPGRPIHGDGSTAIDFVVE